VSAAVRRSFGSLSVPNYRRYFAGQLVSLSGNWMQTVAALWLILDLTGSGIAVGATTALQFLPMLLFGAWGGLLADRFPKRRLLIVTQSLMALPALALFAVTGAGVVAPWMVYLAVLAMGAVNAVDNPTRQSFVIEMVGADRLVNAVSLNSVIVQSARIVGPAVAGLLIAAFGVGPCFAVNALTFVAMIAALWRMDPAQLRAAPTGGREPGAIRAGLRYVQRTPELAVPLALMALVGTLGFNFQVVLPLLAKFSFDGGATTYAAMVSAMAVRMTCGVCDAQCSVRRRLAGSHAACAARGSIGEAFCRRERTSTLMRFAAAANFCSRPGVFTRPSTMTLFAASGWTARAPAASAARASTIAGVSSISTSTRSAKSSASCGLCATTAAIGSPTKRTTSVARIGWLIGT